jgi:hypothetical protein
VADEDDVVSTAASSSAHKVDVSKVVRSWGRNGSGIGLLTAEVVTNGDRSDGVTKAQVVDVTRQQYAVAATIVREGKFLIVVSLS